MKKKKQKLLYLLSIVAILSLFLSIYFLFKKNQAIKIQLVENAKIAEIAQKTYTGLIVQSTLTAENQISNQVVKDSLTAQLTEVVTVPPTIEATPTFDASSIQFYTVYDSTVDGYQVYMHSAYFDENNLLNLNLCVEPTTPQIFWPETIDLFLFNKDYYLSPINGFTPSVDANCIRLIFNLSAQKAATTTLSLTFPFLFPKEGYGGMGIIGECQAAKPYTQKEFMGLDYDCDSITSVNDITDIIISLPEGWTEELFVYYWPCLERGCLYGPWSLMISSE